MFTCVKLKNFKSFNDITLDLTDKNNRPKSLVLIYGENGIGKSNLASAFYMLSETLRTMEFRDLMQEIFNNKPKNISDSELRSLFTSRFKDIETLINENKTVDSTENLYMEFHLDIKGKNAKYILEMNNSEIVHESLDCILAKNKGHAIDISPKRAFLSEKIFKDKSIIDDFKLLINKFWGKHSFLAILMHEYSDKSAHYYKDKISKNLLDILFYLRRMSCNLKIGNHAEYGLIGLPNYYLKNFDHGEIKTKEVGKLLRAETMLNKFFTSTYRDIEGIYYDKESAENDTIKYTLYVRKNICGTIRNINFDLESTGTQALLRLLPFLLASIEGSTVIIDEFDSGIHDLLSRSLIKSIFKDISGQLIMTTHNTSLMDNTTSVDNNPSLPDIPAECIYTINEDDSNGQKRISCILEHNNKLNSNSNIRKQYVQGKYHGIPDNISLDFKELTNLLLQNKEEDSVL